MKTLVAGWFSFELMGATAGDLMARDVACQWLTDAGHVCEVAHAHPFEGGVDWRLVDPRNYPRVVFVCGPFGNGEPVTEFLERFAGSDLLGLNLSMLESLDVWNPFDVLLERDSSVTSRPDMSFAAGQPHVPVVGKVLVHPQREYERPLHYAAHEAIDRLLASRPVAVVEIDTRLDVPNAGGLRTPTEVESLIARMDAVVTTRLHGTVLAIKNGVPPVAVDPIAGGAKIRRQAETLGWPAMITADAVTQAALGDALDWCLTDEARTVARRCCRRAREELRATRDELLAALGSAAGSTST
jgi:hypothetical protein